MARLAISLAGAAIGNAILPGIGGQIGFALGSVGANLLFPETLPPQFGPKIEDDRVTVSTYGTMIPKVWGTISVAGNVIDASTLTTVATTQEVGGKGGPTQEVTSYTQYMDYCVALADSVDGLVKIFINETLVFDATPGSSVKRPEWLDFSLYTGSETQQPDPTFEALRGVDNVPGYRSVAYVVFRNIRVTDFGTTSLAFRFVVTTNGSASISSTTYNQGGTGLAYHITHNPYTDLMIGCVHREPVGGSDTTDQMIVAIDPYSQTEVYKTEITDADVYGEASWVLSCSFFGTDSATGALLFPANYFVAVYHEEGTANPQRRFLRFFYADSGIELGKAQITNSEGTPGIIAPYNDDAVFYQSTQVVSDGFLYRHVVEYPLLSISSSEVNAPDGYKWFDAENARVFNTHGSRFYNHTPKILVIVENSTTAAYGFTTFDDDLPGLGATTWTPDYTTVAEIVTADGTPNSGVYDEANSCWWINSTDASSNTVIIQVSTAGTITSKTNWNTTFSIAGTGDSLAIDETTDLLWIVIGGVAYAWPTYDLTQTPVGYGSGISDDTIAWHPYSGTLFTGSLINEIFTQHQLQNLSGSGVSLQSIVEAICDEPGTNLTTADRSATALSAITVDGFKLSRVEQRRGAINALRTAYLWDFVPRSGVLTAVLRGGASSATLDDDDIGAHVYGSQPPPRIEIERRAETALPKKLAVGFLDAAQNYEPGYEAATRLASDSGTEARFDLAVVLSHDDAAQLSSVLLHEQHVGAESYLLRCMPDLQSTIIPAAVVTATIDADTYVMRLSNASIIDGGIIECNGMRYDASVYTDFTVGGTTRDRLRSINSLAATQLIIADTPAFRDQDLSAGYYVAGATYSQNWDGAVVYRSSDGSTYTTITTLNTEATYGFITSPIGNGEETDISNSLSVRLINGSLASISDTIWQTSDSANYAAIGSNGRWEIIKFQTVAESNGIYTLTNIVRGLRDTLDAKTTHVAGDKFLLLDSAALRYVTIPDASVGQARYFKGVTIGRLLDQTAPIAATPAGGTLTPFRPVCLDTSVSGSDFVLAWNRQDRKQARFLRQPQMSESTEAYSVDILDSLDNVLRTEAVTSETFTYTSAMQTTDFGTTIDAVLWRVAQVSSVVAAGGYAYASGGLFSKDYDGLVTGRSNLIDFWPLDETSGTTAASNSGSHDGTYTNMSTSINSTALLLDGSPSVQFNPSGSDDDLQVTAWAGLTSVRGIEFWIKPVAFSGSSNNQLVLFHTQYAPATGHGWAVMITPAGVLQFALFTTGFASSPETVISGSTLSLDTLYYVAIDFGPTSGNTVNIYVNNVLVGTGTVATTVTLQSSGYFGQYLVGSSYQLRANVSKWAIYNSALSAGDRYNSMIRGIGG